MLTAAVVGVWLAFPRRFLMGDRLTEADLRLFATLIRFDEVYVVHFKTNKKRIQDYPNLSNVRETVDWIELLQVCAIDCLWTHSC